LPQKVEKEPVSNRTLAYDGVNAFFFYSPVSEPENESPNIGTEYDDDPEQYDYTREEAKEEKPEPDKNIDFLVNYIERKNA